MGIDRMAPADDSTKLLVEAGVEDNDAALRDPMQESSPSEQLDGRPRESPHPRARLGSYILGRRLGAGGMGEVFAARHARTGEAVALKILHTATATRLYRFKREFRALAGISHPNLIRLYELVVPSQGSAYFTMEQLDGRSFVEWVREPTPVGTLPDLGRLESALVQLVEGIHHLHANGRIHRDIKPSNVLVTRDGRVVILDFGVVSELSPVDAGVTGERQIVGTPSFMAPEQALGQRVGPAADYYAIGVMLFQCLTGRLPHEGSLLEQLLSKQDDTPDPASEIAGIPQWLRMLCVRLMARDPSARIGGSEVLELLRAASLPRTTSAQIFVGRTSELAVLHRALESVVSYSRPVIVHVRGESGYGKSSLIRQFRSQVPGRELLVFEGRCGERETVPYKGIDTIVDALSVYLRRLSQSERADLRPPDLDALVRVFPVLDEIWKPAGTQLFGLNELRKLGSLTLRKLLRRVTDGRTLLVHIDDFQWADLDSVKLLHVLTRPPGAPAMLLVLSYRPDLESSDALRELLVDEHLAGPHTHTIELGALSASDANDLAHALLRANHKGSAESQDQAEAIALRSRGNPLFISQLALGEHEDAVPLADLEQIIRRRLAELDDQARRLLEVVSVFGGPLPVALALTLCPRGSEDVVPTLCDLGLLVRSKAQGDRPIERIETAHDRVRDVVLAQLDPEERHRLHWQIGERLRARHEGAVEGDEIFAIANHFNAGMGVVGALPRDLRLELARLNHRAGQRALESTAWVAALRYFTHASDLVQPWLEEARQGRGEYELSLAVTFGRAQAEVKLDDAQGDATVEDLLGWSLSSQDYCRIVQWYAETILWKARVTQSVAFGLKALAQLGCPIPARPSWIRALASYLRGWRAIRRVGLERIRSLPPITDDRVRTAMEIIAATGWSAMLADPRLDLTLMGTYGRLLAKHGLHDNSGSALSNLATMTAVLGRPDRARALCEIVEDLMTKDDVSPAAKCASQAGLLVVWPLFLPMPAIVARAEAIYRRVCEIAPQSTVENIGLLCANNYYYASVPLPVFVDHLRTMETLHDRITTAWVRHYVTGYRRYTRALMGGEVDIPSSDDLFGIRERAQVFLRASMVLLQIEVALVLGDADGAWEYTRQFARNYVRKIGPTWLRPAYSMLSVIVMSDQWLRSSKRERRRMKRMMRAEEASVRRWAKGCPETYEPMADIIEGEMAALEDRYDEAVSAYEQARTTASRNNTSRLVGIASERLAKLARRKGHSILAQAALDAARGAYDAWGATAVVYRLDRERASSG